MRPKGGVASITTRSLIGVAIHESASYVHALFAI